MQVRSQEAAKRQDSAQTGLDQTVVLAELLG